MAYSLETPQCKPEVPQKADDRVLTQMVERMGDALRSLDRVYTRLNGLRDRLGVDWTPSMEVQGLVEADEDASPVCAMAGQVEAADNYLSSIHAFLTGLETL